MGIQRRGNCAGEAIAKNGGSQAVPVSQLVGGGTQGGEPLIKHRRICRYGDDGIITMSSSSVLVIQCAIWDVNSQEVWLGSRIVLTDGYV